MSELDDIIYRYKVHLLEKQHKGLDRKVKRELKELISNIIGSEWGGEVNENMYYLAENDPAIKARIELRQQQYGKMARL